jgi:hypothetical protein
LQIVVEFMYPLSDSSSQTQYPCAPMFFGFYEGAYYNIGLKRIHTIWCRLFSLPINSYVAQDLALSSKATMKKRCLHIQSLINISELKYEVHMSRQIYYVLQSKLLRIYQHLTERLFTLLIEHNIIL